MKSFLHALRKKRIIEILAGFIGGGWLILEFVHWILIDHYHFPEESLDIALITLICALICTLTWRIFAGVEKRARKVKLELILIPLIILITAFFDVRFIQQIGEPEAETISEKRWKNSIAVLSFEDLSPQKDQEYFCDGMANSIINTLSTISGLSVRARGSSFSFKGRQRDINEIGKRLNVETVLEGSVQKAGSRLRITAQLINVSDESLLWSVQYNRELDDIFAIQDEITLAIVNKLKIRLFGEEKAELLKRHTENLEAHNLYLLGLHHWNKFTEEDVKKSINYFEQTIEKDPSFALAYTGIADCYILFGLGHGSGTHLPIAMYKKAKQAVTKALKIDNALGEAHSTLGFINFAFEFDWVRGEQEFKQAIQLSPSLAQAQTRFALLLSCLGRHDEAIETSKRGQELDPLSPILYTDAGLFYLESRLYDKAIAPAKKALELDPDFLPALDLIAMVHLRKGMFEEAIKEMQDLVAFSGEKVEYIARLGNLYALIGRRDDARKILQELLERSKRSYVSSYDVARVYIGLREKTEAINWLEKAYKERAHWIAKLKIDEDFDVLRSDPRFKALLKKMGLE